MRPTLPSRWSTLPLKYIATPMVVKALARDIERPYIGLEQIESGTGRLVNTADVASGETANLFEVGDVLFGKLRPYLAKVLQASFAGRCTSEALVLRPSGMSPSFLRHLCLSDAFLDLVNSSTYGAQMPRASWDFIGNIEVPCPTHAEQRAIADFLDKKTAAIDALIAKKGRLIELLQEERQALITQAVTKGLNPNAPMKDSGIEWLGEIPAHWEVKRARFLFRELSLPPGLDDGVVTAFRDGQVTLRENRRSEGYTFAIKELGYQRVRGGDLVLQSMDAFAGAIGVSESTGKCSPEYVVCEPRDARVVTSMEYFARVLREMAKQGFIFVICPSVRERAPRFRFATFKDVLLPVPPPNEQKQIDAYLAVLAQAAPLAERLKAQVERLREYRQALITAAVTGKLEVAAPTALAATISGLETGT